jgi:hypothetical protein
MIGSDDRYTIENTQTVIDTDIDYLPVPREEPNGTREEEEQDRRTESESGAQAPPQ